MVEKKLLSVFKQRRYRVCGGTRRHRHGNLPLAEGFRFRSLLDGSSEGSVGPDFGSLLHKKGGKLQQQTFLSRLLKTNSYKIKILL